MKKTWKIAIAAGVLIAGTVMTPMTASAGVTTQKVGGGLWNWGQTGGTAISQYHHASKYHSATVCNGTAGGVWVTCNKAVAQKGTWAKASMGATFTNTEHSYWNTY